MVNISDKVTRNRFHWFQQLKAYIPPVPPQFLEPTPEPEPVPNRPWNRPNIPLTSRNLRNRF